MSGRQQFDTAPNQVEALQRDEDDGSELLRRLVQGPATPAAVTGIVIGELLALADDGMTPMVRHPLQASPTTALRARSVVDLHGAHIGREVVLMFEQGDVSRPIVMGVLRDSDRPSEQLLRSNTELVVDGERLLVGAKDQLVLRCGKASITLTRVGKVLIEGAYLLSRSTGVNRIKGGSVQLN